MQGANAQLRGRVQDLAAELREAREELAALGGLQEELAADVAGDVDVESLVAAALGRERAAQDARNSKVLELLKSKVCTLIIIHARQLVPLISRTLPDQLQFLRFVPGVLS